MAIKCNPMVHSSLFPQPSSKHLPFVRYTTNHLRSVTVLSFLAQTFDTLAVKNHLLSISACPSTSTRPRALPLSNPSAFPASFDPIILPLVCRSPCPGFSFSPIPLGLLSHYRFRFEAEVESAAAGYGDDAEGGRSA